MEYNKFKRGWLGGKTKWIISSPMGMRRLPKQKIAKLHTGNDVSTPVGTKIYAPSSGNVKQKKDKNGYGLYAILSTNDGYYFYFAHLSKVIKTGSVKEGDLIAETGGDPIKDADNAGRSTAPHLHFEVRINGDKSKLVDGKYFISDTWIDKQTKKIITISSDDIPLITTKESDYTEEQKVAVKKKYSFNESDMAMSKENNASGETDWSETEEYETKNNEVVENLVPGIWQIVKLVLDSDVANLRIRNAATSLQQGSLINFFQKVCQQPLVEFFGDTYGDQYYFVVRRPPFDKEGMKKTMDAQGLFNNGERTETRTIYDIYENDIVNSNISFNNQNIYSWYQYFPIYELGSPSDLEFIIPAILFPEYAAIWGSRSLVIRSQYRDFRNPIISDESKNGEKSEQGDLEVSHCIRDLKYLIESNCYNPFVRQGTITILGNRKIKRGVFIRVFWNSLLCPEIFYVENVSQNYSVGLGGVNRTTTLTLSHGMLSDYIFDNTIDSVKLMGDGNTNTVSYFNIIDFGDYDKKSRVSMSDWRKLVSGWKVNTSIFMFFLRKTQFLNQQSDTGVGVSAK